MADGHPQTIRVDERLRHITLDRPENDWGNTPRAVGSALAVNSGVKMIGMLDADNWLDPDHFETAIAAASGKQPVDVVFAKRRFRRPDQSVLPAKDEPTADLVDANCYVNLEGAFHCLPWWGTVPKEIAYVADRAFRRFLGVQPNLTFAETSRPTVNYTCLLRSVYEALGETPPPGAKDPAGPPLDRWLETLAPRQHEIAMRRLGLKAPLG